MTEVRKPETIASTLAAIDRRLRRVEALAARAPSQTVAVELANQYTTVTSASFVPTAHANLPAVYGQVLNVWVAVTSASGVTGEVRLREAYSGAVTDAVATPSLANGFCFFEWLHGVDLVDDQVEFQIQGRRTAGAGDLNVYAPRRFLLDSAVRFPDADAAGNGSFA